MKRIKIKNPILNGFHPDPCICRAKGKYYLITSTFEWLPGVSLYESKDLVNWEPKGGILRDLKLEGIPDSAGIWAPSLSYYEGCFYLIYTVCKQIDGYFKDVENYVITASDIEGPWSEPVFVNASGFDPSMYHENGRHYILNPQWDARPLSGHQKFNGLILQEFDLEKGMTGEPKVVYGGSGWGSAEGPHLMKNDGYYYILAAEGGTGRHHSICVARSKSIRGPYEVSPYTPMITAWEQETALKKSGHGNLVETDTGDWYLVHLCGRYLPQKNVCILGRETAMQRVEWIDGWPRIFGGGCTPREAVEIEVSDDEELIPKRNAYRADFVNEKWTAQKLEEQEWLALRSPISEKLDICQEGLRIKGGASLTSAFSQAMLARRVESFHTEAETEVQFRPYHYSQTAGLTCYYNTKVFHYLYVGYDEAHGQRVLSILSRDNDVFCEPLEGSYVRVPDEVQKICLKMKIRENLLWFSYAFDGGETHTIGEALRMDILSDEHAAGWAYTGTVLGITAVDTFNKDISAVFSGFCQRNTDTEEWEDGGIE